MEPKTFEEHSVILMVEERKGSYYGLTSKKVKTENFNISITNHPADSKTGAHYHTKPYLCLLATGKYEEKTSHRRSYINSGVALFRKAGHEHANRFSSQEALCLNVEIDDPDQFKMINDINFMESLDPQRASIDLYRLMYGLRKNYSMDILNIFCYESFTAHFENCHLKGKLNWVQKVKEYIIEHKMESISLQKLSEEFNLHPNYLVRKFKEVTGFRLSDYLSKVRIEFALDHLINSDWSLTDLAISSGFYDQSHFNRAFRNQLKSSPNKFRKVLKG